ncbi:helix-turn-helix domain-containing protein [Bradyrhizobium sp. AUGA SZCCT0431]|uniref:helix-turn-helix domain-containing protein n=1 Tax=Bradyrhizobium sp. AUGA SZCCT0431 TaxID=2807674 RepID=UPI001BA5DB83|nr:hypothetical protein [Bradyrhizobium sp. AUGA SZCCT0431]
MTQNDRIKALLEKQNFVTRNHCLRTFPAITRLSARIMDLEKEGYVFKGENVHGDYVYTVTQKPAPKTLAMRI